MVTSIVGRSPATPGPAHRHAWPARHGLVIICLGLTVKLALIVIGSPVLHRDRRQQACQAGR